MKSGFLQDKLSQLLFRYRNTPQSTTGTTPSQLLLGRKMSSPLDPIHLDLQRKVEQEQGLQEERYHPPNILQTETRWPCLRLELQSQLILFANLWLLGQVAHVQCEGTWSFRVTLGDGRIPSDGIWTTSVGELRLIGITSHFLRLREQQKPN